MKKRLLYKVAALCLTVSLLLSGCGVIDLGAYFRELGALLGSYTVAFSDMEYTRPNMGAFRQAVEAVEDQLQAHSEVDDVMDCVYGFYEAYHDFYTNYALADIYYCKDLTDIYWQEEYNYCLEASAEVDAELDQLLYALADSPHRADLESEEYFGRGFFDEYEGESVWNEAFTDLMEQEAQLQSRYYALSTQALELPYYSDEYFTVYGTQMGELFVELVALRQQIAEAAGYDDYLSFAYDFYYYRDYTPEQARVLLDDIHKELVPLYRQLGDSDVWYLGNRSSSEEETFAYVKNCAETMGGTVAEAFKLLEQAGLYDISYGENKYDASFEIYLMSYYEPFIFVNPTGSVYDQLTFAHEFGHFCNDYASSGSIAGVDVAEVFSQAMEYLSLCYGEDTQDLERLKMADCLCLYVEQAAYASFEQQVYGLRGEELTAENVYALYEQIGRDFGLDTWNWDSRSFVCITHFFTNPMYIISYVVSNDAAVQLYQQEKATAGAGVTVLEDNLATEELYFLSFLESAGLESPFAEGRIRAVGKTLEDILQ